MTVADMLESMTMREYLTWLAWFEERETQHKRTENRARGIVDFSDPKATAQLMAMVGKGA